MSEIENKIENKETIFSKNAFNDLTCPTNLPLAGTLPKVGRIIVIGDVHGDIDQFKETLKLAKLIDDKDNWTGGETVVVQLGDLIDSCRGVDCFKESKEDKGADLELLKYVVKLNEKAQKNGGSFYSLIGNHEIMNVYGDFSYVSPKNFDIFADLLKEEDKENISLYEARKEAFKPGSPIANYLACSKLGVLIIGSNLFVHAGLISEVSKKYTAEEINKILREWLITKTSNPLDCDNSNILFSSKYSPFWMRVLGQLKHGIDTKNETEYNEKCKDIDLVLESWNVKHIHIGHSPTFIQNLGINHTCDEKIWRHDIGMSHAFSKFDKNGRSKIREIQVLEILDDTKFNILK